MTREFLQENENSRIEYDENLILYKTHAHSLLRDPADVFGENSLTKVENEEDCYQIDLDTALTNFANKYGDNKKFSRILEDDPSLRFIIEADNLRRSRLVGAKTLPEFYGIYAEKDKERGTYRLQIRMEAIPSSTRVSEFTYNISKEANPRERRDEIGNVLMASTQMAEDYDIMHTNGILHRDTTSRNLIIERYELPNGYNILTVRIIDLGLSINGKRDTNNSSFGTPLYMSPEQVSSFEIDHRADQYSLATIYAEMLAGSRDITNRTTKKFSSLPDQLLEIVNNKEHFIPELDGMISKNLGIDINHAKKLGNILRKACNYKREDRYNFCLDFISDLQEAYFTKDEVFIVEDEEPAINVEVIDLTENNLPKTLLNIVGKFLRWGK